MSVHPFHRTSTMNFCKAIISDPFATPAEGTFIKVPVLLQKFTVQIPMQATINFPKGEKVLEIKQIKKHVFITQCRLLQPHGSTQSGNLFLSGFVRKNIQYAANPIKDCENEVLSKIKSLTVEVPFDCVVQIDQFRRPPIGPFLNTREEFGFFTSQPLGMGFPEKDSLLSNDFSQFNQQSTEFFNELPFCEIVRSDITEFDEALNRKSHMETVPFEIECRVIKCSKCNKCNKCRWCNNKGKIDRNEPSFFTKSHFHSSKLFASTICTHCNGGKPKRCEICVKCMCEKCCKKPIVKEVTFTELSEKMVLDLTLKLLQKQTVLLN